MILNVYFPAISVSQFQVCDWLYPLMSTDSPVLLCNTGVYMFPDLMSPSPGSYVGVVLSSELSQSQCQLFKDILYQMTDLRVQVSKIYPLYPGDTLSLDLRRFCPDLTMNSCFLSVGNCWL